MVDCLRSLPFDEALAIADSALRACSFTPEALLELAGEMTGPGAGQGSRVAREADRRAANPFESVLRAIALDVPRPASRASGRRRRVTVAAPGPGRPRAPARAGGGLVRLARQPSGAPTGLPALQPARPARVRRPPLHLGGRHARRRLRSCFPTSLRRRTGTTWSPQPSGGLIEGCACRPT
jgi:hypothetical protein